jgi:hypothetical protein
MVEIADLLGYTILSLPPYDAELEDPSPGAKHQIHR